jgi:hypothetical protein
VELVETDAFAARRGKHPDMDGNQAKREVAFPDSRRHTGTPFVTASETAANCKISRQPGREARPIRMALCLFY